MQTVDVSEIHCDDGSGAEVMRITDMRLDGIGVAEARSNQLPVTLCPAGSVEDAPGEAGKGEALGPL
jgi:hypothetical protein